MGERDYFEDPLEPDELKTAYPTHYKTLRKYLDDVEDAFDIVDSSYPGSKELYEAVEENGFAGRQADMGAATKALALVGGVDTWNDIESASIRYVRDTFNEDRVKDVRSAMRPYAL